MSGSNIILDIVYFIGCVVTIVTVVTVNYNWIFQTLGKAASDTIIIAMDEAAVKRKTIQKSEQIITNAQINKTLHENIIFKETPNNKSLATVFIHKPILILNLLYCTT